MGLHFYQNPDKAEAADAAAKLDRAAAHCRSTIRREPSIRPSRDQSSSTGLTNIIRTRAELRQAQRRAQEDTAEADAQIELLELELNRLRRHHRRHNDRRSVEGSHALGQAEARRTNGSTGSPASNDFPLPTNANSSPREDGFLVDQVFLPRPMRESNLRHEVALDSTRRSASPRAQSVFLPSPPVSDGDTYSTRFADGPLEAWEVTPPLTEGFAPARRARSGTDVADSPAETNVEPTRSVTHDRRSLETPPPESWESSYPPLRRVPHMSPRPLPRTIVDGLGDRRRSPSPSHERAEEETWNQLLATIDNRADLSSTSTSFASMTDLLSTSRSSSHRSSNTQNTSTSFGEIGTSADELCDPPNLPPGITEEDARQLRARHGRSGRRVMAPRRYIPEPNSPDSGSSNVADGPLDGGREVAGSHADRRAGVLSRNLRRRQNELMMMQIIAQRHRNNEPMTEDMWRNLLLLQDNSSR